MRSSFFTFLTLFGLFTLVSCDKDFNELGSSIVDDDHFGFDLHESPVVAYNQYYGAVQTSRKVIAGNTTDQNIPISSLGYYNNAIFGKVTASFLTQLELQDVNPSIDLADDPQIDKVELNVPYYGTLTSVDDDGNRLYELDSVQGSAKFRLNVFASGYYLRDFDPATGFQEVQKYYSDQSNDIVVDGERLNNSTDPKQNDEFYFDATDVVTYKTDEDGLQVVDQRLGPQLRLDLRKEYFQQKLFTPEGVSKLVSNNAFKEWFRGLYFKAEATSDQGSLNKINFGRGTITVTYTTKVSDDDPDTPDTRSDPKTLKLNLAGNVVNLFDYENNSNYMSAVSSQNMTDGDSHLWLRGGAGSMAVIKLFNGPDNYRYDDDCNSETPDDPNIPDEICNQPNGIPDELDDMRHNKWLINDASMTFYLADDVMNPSTEKPAYRIYLYDLKNKKRLVDWDYDVTTIAGASHLNKYVHGGIYIPSKRRYTIRLTNHIRNLVNTEIDSTNVQLGLVVTETINNVGNVSLKTPLPETPQRERIDRVPAGAMTSQRGVVLYGNNNADGTIPTGNPDNPNDPANPDKRIRLKIYYTKND